MGSREPLPPVVYLVIFSVLMGLNLGYHDCKTRILSSDMVGVGVGVGGRQALFLTGMLDLLLVSPREQASLGG